MKFNEYLNEVKGDKLNLLELKKQFTSINSASFKDDILKLRSLSGGGVKDNSKFLADKIVNWLKSKYSNKSFEVKEANQFWKKFGVSSYYKIEIEVKDNVVESKMKIPSQPNLNFTAQCDYCDSKEHEYLKPEDFPKAYKGKLPLSQCKHCGVIRAVKGAGTKNPKLMGF